MTIRLTRLRIAGFKSFAEPASLDILPGLTGVVGPNGCGKSNVVEALRWAMGETSARSLRGGEMDDVIFAGTMARASRNLAEVSITLEATPETPLPAPFEKEQELQVTRRIERGAGSGFRANGREVRARDVQTLYADLASGARSSGMVSQGRVAALVGAKPEERRHVLEEAAGITGLHARRHEAELKLRATEQNLSRAEDLRSQLDASRDALRKQARQASRYRNLSGHLVTAEAEYLSVLHGRETGRLAAAEEAHAAALARVAAAGEAAGHAATALTGAEAALPEPRARETGSRSLLERRRLEAETLAAEAERAARVRDEAAARLQDLASDLAGARQAADDAEANRLRLSREAEALAERIAALPNEIETASSAVGSLRTALDGAETIAHEAAIRASEAAAEHRQASLALDEAVRRDGEARGNHERALSERVALEAATPLPQVLADAASAVAAAEQAVVDARAAFVTAEAAKTEADMAHHHARRKREQLVAEAEDAGSRLADAKVRLRQALSQAARLEEAWGVLVDSGVPQAALDKAASDHRMAETALVDAEAAFEAASRLSHEAAEMAAAAARNADDLQSAHRRALEAREAASSDLSRKEAEIAGLQREVAAAEAELAEAGALAEAEAALASATEAVSVTQAALARLGEGMARAQESLSACRTRLATCEADVARTEAEAAGLRAALGDELAGHGSALDAIRVPEGLEAAIGAALEGSADASLDEQSPSFWRLLPEEQGNADANLLRSVQAPDALRRALSHVRLLDDGEDGDATQRTLAPGEIAVDRHGNAWRWDGLVRRAGASSQAASRLKLRNQLETALAGSGTAAAAAAEARLALQDAEDSAAASLVFENEARQARDDAEQVLRERRETSERLGALAARSQSRLAGLYPAMERATAALQEAASRLADADETLANMQSAGAASELAEAAARDALAATSGLAGAKEARQQARTALGAAASQHQRLRDSHLAEARRKATLEPQLEQARTELSAAEVAAAELDALVAALDTRLADERDHEASAASAREVAEALERAARDRLTAEAALDAARLEAARLEAEAMQVQSRLAALDMLLERSAAACANARDTRLAAEERVANVADPGALAEAAQASRGSVIGARSRLAETERLHHALQAEAGWAEAQRTKLVAEVASWETRRSDAQQRAGMLGARELAATAEVASLSQAHDDIAARAASSDTTLAAALATHEADTAALRGLEDALRQAMAFERETTTRLGVAREALVRTEGARDAALGSLAAILARIVDRLGQEAALPEASDISEIAEERARKKLDRLTRERDEMGPVNLMAEAEAEELDGRISAIEQEREELNTAIARLRGAIGHLNREGRTRLVAVFEEVDRHFRALFTRMMGGGRAHLAWSGNEDPLLAGLEIYAEPPGKKLSTLSLLSGGEQALTALSLIFAVFRCMPAPVCVLDEVDAPLDDANVERFCTLLNDVVRETGTRFLVVTHHQLTMSRMDRLFGVTMQERGVSRLLSVDLGTAATLAEQEPALQAAE